MEDKEFITAAEIAARLRVRPATVYAWAKNKKIPHNRVGPRTVRFNRKEYLRWEEETRSCEDAPADLPVKQLTPELAAA